MCTPKNAGPLSRMTSASSGYISPSTKRVQSKLTNGHTPAFVNVSENDDAAERRERRRSKVLELQRQLQSPATPTERRRSLPLNGLTTDQLTEHYSSCIKLSAENKINAKNAFGLHLIDYMSEMLKEKMGELTNFQMASCTLDASAKIYAGRVDAVHADTYKVLSGLGHGDKQNKKGDDQEGDVGKATKKKKVRQGHTVVTNLNTITTNKVDVEFEVDPLFQKTAAAFDEGGTFSLLLNHLPVRDDSCELLLDSSCIIGNMGQQPVDVQETEKKTVNLSEIRGHYNGVNFEALQICPAFSEFEFTNWSQNGENTFSEVFAKMAQSEKAFDINAVPEPIEEDHPADDYGEDHFNGGDYSDDGGGGACGSDHFSLGESVFMGDGKEAQMITEQRNGMTMASTKDGKLCLQLALQPGEYSYFKPNAFTMWAGPQHWKVKPFSKEPGEKKEEGTKKSKKPAFKLDYDQDVDFSKCFSTSKAATTLSKATLDKYSKTETTLPEDLHYHPDSLFKLFLKPSFMVKRQAIETSEGMDDGIEGYDYNNENDCANFCPAMNAEDDDFDVDVGGGGDFTTAGSDCSSNLFQSTMMGEDSVFETTAFSGDKLVAQPHRVTKIDVPYAKTAKKMDVKKLKSAMWRFLTYECIEENEKDSEDMEDEVDKVSCQKSFKEMYSSLPETLSKNMAKNLSVPIAFVCLLHLCNEKNLVVSTEGNMEDLNIVQTNIEHITPT